MASRHQQPTTRPPNVFSSTHGHNMDNCEDINKIVKFLTTDITFDRILKILCVEEVVKNEDKSRVVKV